MSSLSAYVEALVEKGEAEDVPPEMSEDQTVPEWGGGVEGRVCQVPRDRE